MNLPLDTDSTLDLALLGMTLPQAQPLPALCAHARALVAPWLTPTEEVVAGRIERLCARHELRLIAGAVEQHALATREAGGTAFQRLMERPLPRGAHAPAMAAETVKLAFVDLLQPSARAAVAADLLAARACCQRHLRERLAGFDDAPPAVARGLLHQIRVLEIGAEAVRAHLAPA
jgi:hypothetical protein